MFVDNRRHLARNGHAMRLGNRTLHDHVTLLFSRCRGCAR
jgi:hypothetical protein